MTSIDKTIVNKDMLTIREQFMATKPLAPTAPGKSRELLKKLTKSQQKGFPPSTVPRQTPPTADAVTKDSKQSEDGN